MARLLTPDEAAGAVFSADRRYRYDLWRRWSLESPPVMFVGLNPSVADESANDRTLSRCVSFAKRWGFGGVCMQNAFDLVSTDPAALKSCDDPVGALTDYYLSSRAAECETIVAAWGMHCPEIRADRVLSLLDRPVLCLGTTRSGAPRHPLYLRRDTPLVPWRSSPKK